MSRISWTEYLQLQTPFFPIADDEEVTNVIPDLSFNVVRDPWLNPRVVLSVEPDPLGPVNKIVSLLVRDANGSRRIGKSVLYPIGEGSTVRLAQMPEGRFQVPWPSIWMPWTVTVDDRVILRVPYHESLPPVAPKPPPPWRQRARKALNARVRQAANRFAARFGYIHESDDRDWGDG